MHDQRRRERERDYQSSQNGGEDRPLGNVAAEGVLAVCGQRHVPEDGRARELPDAEQRLRLRRVEG